jgi:rubrerythrin
MQLGTFGAILTFAIGLEQRAAEFYERAAQGGMEALFQELGRGARKRLERLEQARREGVSEMILEPITGLDSDAYRADWVSLADPAEQRRQAQIMEETAFRFYQEAAAKLPIREVARLFQRLAQESQQRKAKLSTGR